MKAWGSRRRELAPYSPSLWAIAGLDTQRRLCEADSVLAGFATSLISGGQGRLRSLFWHSTADRPQVPRHTKRSCLIQHVERVSRFPKTGGELDGSRVTLRANTSLQGS